jgi:putative ABC transport system permease protein
MLRNYLNIAFRNLRKRLGYTAINVVGLAVGLASCILIGLWVEDELSYGDFHANADRTYRVLNEFDMPELQVTISNTPPALQPTLETNYPQVDEAVRVAARDGVVQQGPQRGVESDVLFADDGFFDVFSFPLARGMAALGRPGTALLTPTLATKYFPNADPIGQTIQFYGREFEVTGIVEAPPTNTHLDYTMIVSLVTLDVDINEWRQNNWTTYVMLQPSTTADAFAASLEEVARNNMVPEGMNVEETGLPQRLHLQPITGIHLGTGAPSLAGGGMGGSMTYVLLFSGLALFVLLLAVINFMNLATARATERANEVGVRKAMGADRGQLAGQFLGESVIMTTGALGVALGLCTLFLPAFNDLAGKSIAADALVSGGHLLAYAGLIAVVGLLSGSYPALVLSRFVPTETLRGKTSSGSGSARLRQGLVVLQFAISIALIAGTGVVSQQVSYMQSAGLGFNDENVVVIDRVRNISGPIRTRADVSSFQDRFETFKQELEQQAGVVEAASGYSMPGTFFLNSMWQLDRPEAEPHNFDYTYVGYDYVETLGIELAAGRDFSRGFAGDTAAVLLNEAGAREFGLSPDEAVGEMLIRGDMRLEIIGVTKNFHFESLRREIHPMILFHEILPLPQYVAVRVVPDQTAEVLEALRATWADFSDLPIEYSFLADDLAAQYRAEVRLEQLFTTFAGLAIVIACLGLLGLAAFTAQQRTKEIGIRKALGATEAQVVGLLSREFVQLVGIAFVVAVPVAYWAMSQWLKDFAYRIDLRIGLFLLAGGLALAVALLTVSVQALRAARTDPVNALRSE